VKYNCSLNPSLTYLYKLHFVDFQTHSLNSCINTLLYIFFTKRLSSNSFIFWESHEFPNPKEHNKSFTLKTNTIPILIH
jgi:hypothetical protein